MPTVLITGASRGLGLEFVRQYSAAGWQVLAGCRTPDTARDLAALAAASSGRITVHALDVEDHASIDRLATTLATVPLDLLLNNAGSVGTPAPGESRSPSGFGQSRYDDWLTMFRVNVMGPMKMAEAFASHLEAGPGGTIATLSSMLGSMTQNATGGVYAYRATKAGVNAVMKSMSIDLAPRGITVVTLHPGWVRTDMGGPTAPLDVDTSVAQMRATIAALTPETTGRFLLHDGTPIPW